MIHRARTASLPKLVAAGLMFVFVLMAVPRQWRSNGSRQPVVNQLQPPSAPSSYEVHAVDYLPSGHVTDGSVDYTEELQCALDAAAGRLLRLPDFPVLVRPKASQPYCLLAPATIRVVGTHASRLTTDVGGVQVLRAEHVHGAHFEGFSIRGVGGDGSDMAHGLLQVTWGKDVRVRDVMVCQADADGIAIANVEGVLVHGCTVEGASKSALYLSDCSDATVSDNRVSDFGGHTWGGGLVIGVGIQLSSNADLSCNGNLVQDGVGIGILCGALSGGAPPRANSLVGNRVLDVSNPSNLNASGGIRLVNSSSDKDTQTLLSANAVRGCGAHGIYVQDHGGSSIVGNNVVESQRAGLLVSTVEDLWVAGNLVLASDTEQTGYSAGIQLINAARRVVAHGNHIAPSALFGPASDKQHVLDQSSGGGHSLEPRVTWGEAPPIGTPSRRGDVIYDTQPHVGGHVGWVCVQAGVPGNWRPFGAID